MCANQASAAPKTHATIVATLVVPTGTGPVMVATPLPTTLVTVMSSPTITSSLARPTRSTSTPAAAAAVISPLAASQSSPSPQKKLGAAQIVGISIGGAAV